MWSVMKKATLLAAGLLVFAGGTANAAVINVKVPFPFVVQGTTLPAGQYRVQRDDVNSSVILIQAERGHNASMFVLTTPAAGHDPAGNTPALTFKRYENQYRLADIWEMGGQGHEVAAHR